MELFMIASNPKKSIALALLVVFSGCALSGLDRARVSVTTAVHVLNAAADALDAADKAHIDAAVKRAQNGDVAGAQAALASWQKKYDACYKGLQVVWDAIRLTADAVDAADQGKTSLNVSNLLKALSDLSKLFADAGIKLPNGVGL